MMKEIDDPNLYVRITAGEGAVDPRLGKYLPDSYSIVLNNIVELVILPWLGRSPWPPAFPEMFDSFSNRDEAARYVLATSAVVVAPFDGQDVLVEHVDFAEHPEAMHNVVWLPRLEHARLLKEVERILDLPLSDTSYRLDEIGSGELGVLIRRDLPRTKLPPAVSRALSLAPR